MTDHMTMVLHRSYDHDITLLLSNSSDFIQDAAFYTKLPAISSLLNML